MFNAFSTALSALKGDSAAVNVISDNLANLNTTGYKESSVSFADLVGQAYGNSDPGFGIAPIRITQDYRQGAIQSSSGSLDAAIKGNGFFSVTTPAGQQLFTRDGHFKVDANGNLTTASGDFLQGWSAVGSSPVNTNGALGNIKLPGIAVRQPVATTQFAMNMNLDSASSVSTTGPNFSEPIEVVDSQGGAHTLTVDFTKTGNNAWSYTVSIPGADLASGTAGQPAQLATGTLAFDGTGKLITPTATANGGAGIAIAVNGLADGASNLNLNWKLYDSSGEATVTQVSQTSVVSTKTQDGVKAGQLTQLAMGDNGQVTATYDNGQQSVVATLALAEIRNPDSLVSAGNNNLQATAATALPSVGVAGAGGRGTIVGGSLESSTVDIAAEFTNLIVMQRAYQANGKVITSADQLTQDTINLKQ